MVIGRSGATRCSPSVRTMTSPNSGMKRATGSSSATLPSSTSIIVATLVIGFVIE